MKFLSGLDEIADRYDAFCFDLWGVLHDGKQAWPQALATLRGLRARGKKIAILSNSPRRAESAKANIRKFGIEPDLYDVLATSGELTYEALRDRPDAWLRKLGHACLAVSSAQEYAYYDDLGLVRTEDPAQASFVFCIGTQGADDRLENYTAWLDAARKRGLPLLCANPDLGVVKDGHYTISAGGIAQAYAERGGDVRACYGKPAPEIFRRALAAMDVTPDRAVMVGDNLRTDILGARESGTASVLVLGGVHAHELDKNLPVEKAVTGLTQGCGIAPNFVLTQVKS